MKWTVEFDDSKHTTKTFDTKDEARRFICSMQEKFPNVRAQLYPAEPEDHGPDAQLETFGGMCEACGRNPAEKDDFLCMECLSRMAYDYEQDKD